MYSSLNHIKLHSSLKKMCITEALYGIFLIFLLALIQCLENEAGQTIMLKVFCTVLLVKKRSILVPLVLKKCGKFIDSSDGLFELTCLDFHTSYAKKHLYDRKTNISWSQWIENVTKDYAFWWQCLRRFHRSFSVLR